MTQPETDMRATALWTVLLLPLLLLLTIVFALLLVLTAVLRLLVAIWRWGQFRLFRLRPDPDPFLAAVAWHVDEPLEILAGGAQLAIQRGHVDHRGADRAQGL